MKCHSLLSFGFVSSSCPTGAQGSSELTIYYVKSVINVLLAVLMEGGFENILVLFWFLNHYKLHEIPGMGVGEGKGIREFKSVISCYL